METKSKTKPSPSTSGPRGGATTKGVSKIEKEYRKATGRQLGPAVRRLRKPPKGGTRVLSWDKCAAAINEETGLRVTGERLRQLYAPAK